MFKKTRSRIKAYLTAVLTALQAVADGFTAQTQAITALTAAVLVLNSQLGAITGPLAYLEADRRTHNQRAGHVITQ